MIETAIKEDLILDKKLIIPKNKLDAIRIMNELHPVVGGQPTHEKDQPNDNNPILDLACTLANIHASGVGEHADLRPIQNEPPSFFYGEGFISGIASLKGNGILAIFGHWHDGSGKYAIKQFYYTDKEISYRNAVSEDQWSAWIEVLTSNSQLDYNKLLNVPITSTLSDDKNKIASIFSVNEVNRKANTAQITANNADAKAVNAQRTADTGVANAKIADDKAGKAQSRADAAFTRVKPVAEGGTGATAVVQARINLGLKSAALADLTSTLSDAKDLAASIFTVNEVNRKANTAQITGNNAYSLAQSKQDKLDFIGTGPEALKKGAFGLGQTLGHEFFEGAPTGFYLTTKQVVLSNNTKIPENLVLVNLGGTSNRIIGLDTVTGKLFVKHYAKDAESVEEVILEKTLGYKQKWRNVTNSRVAATTYVNRQESPIAVSIRKLGKTGGTNILRVDGISVSGMTVQDNAAAVFTIVPPGSNYLFTDNTFAEWSEMTL